MEVYFVIIPIVQNYDPLKSDTRSGNTWKKREYHTKRLLLQLKRQCVKVR